MSENTIDKDPHIITKLEIQHKRKDRCSVYLDGEFAFGISVDLLVQFGLTRGKALTSGQIEEIQYEGKKRNAKERAVRFLSFRDRSEKELRDKLKDLQFESGIIDWVIDEMKRMNLIDDERFAMTLARHKIMTKPMGEYLLRRELKAKGVPDAIIQTAVDKTYKNHDPMDLASQLAVRQMKKYRHIDPIKAKKRVSDFLLRRGFGWDIIHDVLDGLEINDFDE